MDDFTRKFSIVDEKDAEIRHILTTVYQALEEKGYNPIDQLAGYLLSGDPAYVTSYKDARLKIRRFERYELIEALLQAYLQEQTGK